MSKKFYCAKCGLKLKVIQKANPQQGTVMNLVIPHECQVVKVEKGPFRDTKEIIKKAPDLIVIDDIEGESMRSLSKVIEPPGAFKILDEENEKKIDKKIDKLFNDFPFVKKLNKSAAEHETVTQESGDKRGKEHLRNELVVSSAPLSVLNMAARSNNSPVHDLKEPKE